jgi:hypothetical protein
VDRRRFLRTALTVVGTLSPALVGAQASGRPRASEFVFARLRYDSGDWDYNPKVAANVLNSLIEYTNIPVYGEEVVITADSEELFAFPFIFMTGHKLVRFSAKERAQLRRYVEHGGLLFSDDCNHDVAGLYATSFEQEMKVVFPGPAMLAKIPATHPIYSAFFRFPEGPRKPPTSSTAGVTTSCTTTCVRSSTRGESGCSIRTRTTAVNGTSIGATSASSGTIIPASR